MRALLVICVIQLFVVGLSIRSTKAGGFEFDLNELPPEEDDVELASSSSSNSSTNDELNEVDEKHESAPAEVPPATQAFQPFSFGDQYQDQLSKPQFGGRLRAGLGRIGAKAKNIVSKLPEYFNFDLFKEKFKRQYSAAEAFVRKSIFLKRCLRIFKLRITERLGKPVHLEEVNKFSDRTPNEIKRMFMSGPPIELKPANQSYLEYEREIEREFMDRQKWDGEVETQASLNSIDGLNNDHYDDDDDDDLKIDENMIVEESQAQRLINQMLEESWVTNDDELASAIKEELGGKKIEVYSQGALSETRELPWPGQLKSSDYYNNIKSFSSDNNNNNINIQIDEYKPPKLKLGDNLDWSKHECFHTIYDQKDKCGKCYVMATTSLAEFYKCSEERDKINKRKFSKEFILDCGQKFKPSSIYGCKGGSMLETSKFIATAGVYNIKGWRQRLAKELDLARIESIFLSPIDKNCPLDEFKLDFSKWGEIHIEFNPIMINVNEWYDALQDGPLVASVQMPNGIESYKSGTHDGDSCDGSRNWHTMILVGYGIDNNNVPYWRFRNSFGPDWGDQGHFNLAMNVSKSCLIGGVRYFREPMVAARAS